MRTAPESHFYDGGILKSTTDGGGSWVEVFVSDVFRDGFESGDTSSWSVTVR